MDNSELWVSYPWVTGTCNWMPMTANRHKSQQGGWHKKQLVWVMWRWEGEHSRYAHIFHSITTDNDARHEWQWKGRCTSWVCILTSPHLTSHYHSKTAMSSPASLTQNGDMERSPPPFLEQNTRQGRYEWWKMADVNNNEWAWMTMRGRSTRWVRILTPPHLAPHYHLETQDAISPLLLHET